MKKSLKELNKNELFTLQEGTDKMYKLVNQIEANGIIYYLTQRAYGGGNTGFWSLNGDREVFTMGK